MAESLKKQEKPQRRPPRTAEEILKEKERIRKQQQARGQNDDGAHYRPVDSVEACNELLNLLIKHHPDKDPANTK